MDTVWKINDSISHENYRRDLPAFPRLVLCRRVLRLYGQPEAAPLRSVSEKASVRRNGAVHCNDQMTLGPGTIELSYFYLFLLYGIMGEPMNIHTIYLYLIFSYTKIVVWTIVDQSVTTNRQVNNLFFELFERPERCSDGWSSISCASRS